MMEVTTKYGKITGVAQEGYTVFKGVPFAQPPVGSLRWKAPRELSPFQGVFHADHFAPRAMQTDAAPDSFYMKEFGYHGPMSEDCLYLNIWAPDPIPGKKLPVAFWIPGGAFMTGHSYEMEYDGAAYCQRGVILVTIPYRLNVFGMLAHPWLSEENAQEGGPGVSGNYGLLDQIAALKWVRENISAFGGDPENITIFGQSAGARSAQLLMSTPLTKGMISKSILQSSANYRAGVSRDVTLEQAYETGERFVRQLGVKSLAEMRSVPAERLRQEAEKLVGVIRSLDDFILVPVIDRYVLADGSDALIDNGTIMDIPCLIGSTENDITTTPEQLADGRLSPLQKGCVDWSLKLEELGHQPSYVYFFRHRPLGDHAGAFHSADLWYMFGTLNRSWRPKTQKDEALSRVMLDYWTNFMKTGNPNGTGLEEWTPFTKTHPVMMAFD